MKITKRTLTKRILPLLDESKTKDIVAHFPPYPLRKNVLDMTIGEYIAATTEEYTMELLEQRRAYKAFGRVRNLRDQLQQLADYLKRFEIPQTNDEKSACAGIDFPSIGQQMVLDVIKWGFVKHSKRGSIIDDAERVPLQAWLLGKKAQASAAQYERAYSQVRDKKIGKR